MLGETFFIVDQEYRCKRQDKVRPLEELMSECTIASRINSRQHLIDDEKLTALSLCLKRSNCPPIESVNLSHGLFTDIGVIAFSDMLMSNSTIKFAEFGHNVITDEGAIAIAHVLTYHPTLRFVTLNNNNISNEGAIAICNALVGNTVLEEIRLDNNKIGDDGGRAIEALLQTNHTIMKFSISGNLVNNEIMKNIRTLLEPRCSHPNNEYHNTQYRTCLKFIEKGYTVANE